MRIRFISLSGLIALAAFVAAACPARAQGPEQVVSPSLPACDDRTTLGPADAWGGRARSGHDGMSGDGTPSGRAHTGEGAGRDCLADGGLHGRGVDAGHNGRHLHFHTLVPGQVGQKSHRPHVPELVGHEELGVSALPRR